MNQLRPLPSDLSAGDDVLLVEAPRGKRRWSHLSDLVSQARTSGATAHLLKCDFEVGGPWAGIRDLFAEVVRDLEVRAPDLIARHDYELVHVLPSLKRRIMVKNPSLTDLAPPDEKTRNYPADRAHRIAHGLIDLLAEWREGSSQPWLIVCDEFESAGHFSRRFFAELSRRCCTSLRLKLVVTAAPAGGDRLRREFEPHCSTSLKILRIKYTPPDPIDHLGAQRAAEALEEKVAGDKLEEQIHLAELVHFWRKAGRDDKVFKWEYSSMAMLNNVGLYDDAIVYGERVRAVFDKYGEGNQELRWTMLVTLHMSYLAIRKVDEAYQVTMEDMVSEKEHPIRVFQLCYLLAILYARYLPDRDLDRSESLLDEGLRALDRAQLSEDKVHFMVCFNRNALALVRFLQGRHQEAIELCQSGSRRLDAHLDRGQYRLHRSVLLYNIAQVYDSVRDYGLAVEYYSAAMEMDPNYSEYYNDRGNAYLKMGRYQEAVEDYRVAIKLSPPYFEVWTNLGQSLRLLGRAAEAIGAYSRALDLKPDQALALLGRAQALESDGRMMEALKDYNAALVLTPEQWDALASRAVILYETGKFAESLSDLDQAILLAPQVAVLYQNRAQVLVALDRQADAASDLVNYLKLDPDADDRAEIEGRLRSLTNALQVAS
jgi:tetratricopeptide (TPR) repeat protein